MEVYFIQFGEGRYGRIEYIESTEKYQCYETPTYGGDFYKVGEEFDFLVEAKKFLLSLA